MSSQTKPIVATLCYLIEIRGGKQKILLARKARTPKAVKYGIANRLNGYGGHKEDGETVRRCCIRELRAESGIAVESRNLKEVARITYDNNGDTQVLVHVFKATKHKGEPRNSNEMTDPRWYSTENIPYDQMPSGDKLVLPHIIKGEKVEGLIRYDENRNITDYEIHLVDDFS